MLYLSQNRLTSLKGLEYFPKVVTLSVSHNPLTRLDVLNWLKKTKGILKHASFVGTPMTKLPNYRAHVISRLPWLATLDGEVIDEGQRVSAALIIEKERSLMTILIHNDCLNHKLVNNICFIHGKSVSVEPSLGAFGSARGAEEGLVWRSSLL